MRAMVLATQSVGLGRYSRPIVKPSENQCTNQRLEHNSCNLPVAEYCAADVGHCEAACNSQGRKCFLFTCQSLLVFTFIAPDL